MLNIQDHYTYKSQSIDKVNNMTIHPLSNRSLKEYISNTSYANKFLDKTKLIKPKNFKGENFIQDNEENNANVFNNNKKNNRNASNVFSNQNEREENKNLFSTQYVNKNETQKYRKSMLNQLSEDKSFMKLVGRYNTSNNKSGSMLKEKNYNPITNMNSNSGINYNENGKPFKSSSLLQLRKSINNVRPSQEMDKGSNQNSNSNSNNNYNVSNNKQSNNFNNEYNNDHKLKIRSNSIEAMNNTDTIHYYNRDNIKTSKSTLKHDGFSLNNIPRVDNLYTMSDPKYLNYSHTNLHCKKIINSLQMSNNLKVKDEIPKITKVELRKVNKAKNPKEFIEKLCELENAKYGRIYNMQKSKEFLEEGQLPEIKYDKKNIEVGNNFYNNGNSKFMGINYNPYNYDLMASKNRTKRNVFGTLFIN